MSETKKYISIPTIDNCKLPNSIIRKCKEAYRRYGKWKLYDILNADLNNHAVYDKAARDSFKKLELTKRYLYLYRKAMAETLSFVYNVDQTDLVEEGTKEFDNTNVCPYCGRPLTLLTQIGSKKGFPKSHYNDVVKKYEKTVLFNKIPVRSSVNVTLSEYLKTLDPGIQVGYSFVYWSYFENNHVNVDELSVNPEDPTTRIDEEMLATMDPESKAALVHQGNINLFKYLDKDKYVIDSEGVHTLNDNYGKLTIYAVFKSDTDTVYKTVKFNVSVSVKDIFDIYTSSLKIGDVYKEAFSFLTLKDKYYEFKYLTLDTDENKSVAPQYIPDDNQDNLSSLLAMDNVIDDSIYTICVYYAKDLSSEGDYNYADWDMTIRQLAIQVFKEPILKDIIYKSTFAEDGKTIIPIEGSEEVAGVYKFFQWSLDEYGDVFILEDDRSLDLVRNQTNVLENNKLAIYALFKYDIKIGTYAYDDDCYSSFYYLYKGIDKAYIGYTDPENGFVYEYKVNDLFSNLVNGNDTLLLQKEVFRLPLTTKLIYEADQELSGYKLKNGVESLTYKETYKGTEKTYNIPSRITEEEYLALSTGLCRCIYNEQKSNVSYRGYPQEAGSGGSGMKYTKDNKIRIIRYNAINNNGVISVENGRKTQKFSSFGDTGIELTYTTPGEFEIWYNLPRYLWYLYDEDMDGSKLNDIETTWVFNSDPLNKDKYLKIEPPQDKQDLYTRFVNAKMISRTEYLTLTSENKRNCEIERIYYEHQWNDEEQKITDSSGRVLYTKKYTIQEIFNCKSIAEYNTQVGTADLSFGVDTKSYADMTNETYRVYQYNLRLDKNIDRDSDFTQDNEIHYIEQECGLEFTGDTWVYPITTSNRQEFLNLILGAKTQLMTGDTRFVRNKNIVFLSPDVFAIQNIPENETAEAKSIREGLLDYTRLIPTDNTGVNQLYYRLTGLWKCAMFTNGSIFIYRAGDRNWPDTLETGYSAKSSDGELRLKDLVYKYNASLRVNIEHSIDTDNNKYIVAFKDITLVAPGAANYTFYNNSEENVLLVETIASIVYTSKMDIAKFDPATQYIKYSDCAVQTKGYGVAYMAHLTKDTLKAYFMEDADNKARALFEKWKTTLVDPESPNYYEPRTGIDENGKEYVYYIKTDGNLRYQLLKNLTYDELDDYHKISPTVFAEDENGENYDQKKEYFDLVNGEYVALPESKFIIEDKVIKGTQAVSYVKGIYMLLQWEDIADLVTETTTVNGIQIEKLKSPEYNPLLYRAETSLERTLRESDYYDTYGINPNTEETKETKVTVEFSGKHPAYKPEDGSSTDYEHSVYSKWNSSVNAIIDDTAAIVSGGYPNPSTSIRTDNPSDNQFIEEKIEFVALRSSILTLSRSAISYSGDTQSVIGNTETGESTDDANKTVNELDDRVWWNQYSKPLTGKAKNDFITNYGVNFSGWVWTGWKEGVVITDDEHYVIGGASKEVEGGLIEAYPFEPANKANYVSQGFQRILFPKDVNSTFETDQYDTEENSVIITHNRVNTDGLTPVLVNKIDSESNEPARLLRYCSNRLCETYLKRLDKRKWSYQDRDSGVHTISGTNSLYNMLSLDEYLLPITKDGSFKTFKANKFSADDPDKTARFGISDIPKLVTVDPVDDDIVEFGGWTLDKYPWHYGEDEETKAKYNKYVRYYLHRGGNALPDPFRFEFEWKYATNEYSPTKMSGYGNGSGLDDTSTQLDTIKQIDHRTKNRIIPIESRSIPEYQKKYLDVLFNTFESTYIQLNTNTSPYSLFSQEEIYVMNEILTDLFTFNKDADSDHMTDYIAFKLDIVTLMNDIAEYEFNLANYWNDGNYDINKSLLETFYERNHGSGSKDTLSTLSDVEFENAVKGIDLNKDNPQSIFPYYTCKLTKDNWDLYENNPIRRIVIKREYTPNVNTTIRTIMEDVWGGSPSYTGYKFIGWFKDPLTFNQYYPDTSEGTSVISAGNTFTAYIRLDAGTISTDTNGNEIFTPGTNNILGSFEKSLLSFEEGNDIYLKIDVKDIPSKIWYVGANAIVESIKTRLAGLHEKLMMPSEFMCVLFNFIVSSKKYNILETNKGEVSSLFVPTFIKTTSSSEKSLSVARGSDAYIYKGAVISKPWNMATNEDTGKSVKEQYYIIYNDSTFDAYSFFNEGWIKDVYGAENATVKFPLFRDTENPITHNASGSYSLLNIIPFTTAKYESALALIYDKGILLVNLTGVHNSTEDTQWIKLENGDKIVSPEKLFSSSSLSIIDCKLDDIGGNNNLIVISSDSQIATFNLDTETVYNPNVNYLSNVSYEKLNSVRSSLPIMFKKNDSVIDGETSGRALLTKGGRAVTVVNESEAMLIGKDESRYLEKRVGLALLVGYLQPSDYTGDPWVLMPKYIDSGLPQTLSDANYEKLFDSDKEKYRIHPKLTVQYAWDNSPLKNYSPESKIDYEYTDLYTDEFLPSTEGDFRIYHNGSVISKSIYFRYSDEIRKECMIYKVSVVNYTFVRLSFSNTGTGFYDEEFEARLTKSKPVYAFYYKTGVEVDEHYGYKIKLTEQIVDGKDTVTSDSFDEYLNAENVSKPEEFNEVKQIAGWKVTNSFTDYTKNVVDKLDMLENINRIFPIGGYIDRATGMYVHQYIISDGYISQLVQWVDGVLHILGEYNFKDNNELVAVKTSENEITTYLIFKNQRIVALETYEYVPSEISIPRMDDIDFFVSSDSPRKESSISYVTTDKRVVNINFDSTSGAHKDNPVLYCEEKDVLPSNAVSLINCEIQQTEPFKYVANGRRWIVLEGNDRSKLMEAQVN